MKAIQGQFSAEKSKNVKVGVVTARFNSPVTEALEAGAIEELLSQGLSEENIFLVRVPGAVEIPLAAQALVLLCKATGEAWGRKAKLGRQTF